MTVAALVDTNILVYRFDPRDMWAYADVFGLAEMISEDFQHGRLYGSVRVMNPFA